MIFTSSGLQTLLNFLPMMDTCSTVSGVQPLEKTQAWRLEVRILYHTLRELRVVHYSKNGVVLPPGDRYSDMEAGRELERVRKHRIQQQKIHNIGDGEGDYARRIITARRRVMGDRKKDTVTAHLPELLRSKAISELDIRATIHHWRSKESASQFLKPWQ